MALAGLHQCAGLLRGDRGRVIVRRVTVRCLKAGVSVL
jgi:hypothetical protein